MSQMLQEVRQQPEALERTLARERRKGEAFKRALAKRPPRAIMLVARGTSDNAARFGRYLLGGKRGQTSYLSAAALPIALLSGCALAFGALAVMRFRWEADG